MTFLFIPVDSACIYLEFNSLRSSLFTHNSFGQFGHIWNNPSYKVNVTTNAKQIFGDTMTSLFIPVVDSAGI